MVHTLLRIGRAEAAIDLRSIERDLLDILDLHYAVPIQDMNIGQLLMATTDLLRTYRLGLPADLMIITTGVRPLLFGFPALGIIGYLFSGLIGIWLLIIIIRKRKY